MTLRLPASTLRRFLGRAFERIGAPVASYRPVVEGLIETSLRGVDSHGIRLAPHYIEAAQKGRVNLRPQYRFTRTGVATATLDADHGYGMAAGQRAMDKALSMAARSGVGCVAVSNSSHFGAAAIYALAAAREDMLGLCFTSVDALVLPYGGRRPFFGTNPICFAAPCAAEEPVCLDMATSFVAWNKVLQHRTAGRPLPRGWAADAMGRECQRPERVAGLLPLGGYKGYGLALMGEVFASLLSGMPAARQVPRMYPLDRSRRRLGHFFMALEIGRFQNVGTFKRRLRRLVQTLRAEPPAPGFDRVRVANDPEKEAFRLRSREGIPVADSEMRALSSLAENLGLPPRHNPFYP